MEPIVFHVNLDFLPFSATPNYKNEVLIQTVYMLKKCDKEIW